MPRQIRHTGAAHGKIVFKVTSNSAYDLGANI